MGLVNVDWTGELGLLAQNLTEDHDLLEKEDGEGLHLGRAVGCRRGEGVQADQGTTVQQLALRRDLALKKKVQLNMNHLDTYRYTAQYYMV